MGDPVPGFAIVIIRHKGKIELAGKVAAVIALGLIAMPVFNVGKYYLPEAFAPSKDKISNQPVPPQSASPTSPNVYYIILDAYGRSDVLKDLYNFDNSSFISYLKGKGFFVADQSHSNYNQTPASLSSSLNMKYINELEDQMGKSSTDRRPLEELIADSQVAGLFQSLGYQFVTFDTGSLITQIPDSDIYLAPDYQNISQENALLKGFYLNDFEGLFLKTTMVRVWFDEYLARHNTISNYAIEFPYIKQRTRILYTFDQLSQIPTWSGHYFVFAHVLAPHPPFVFDSQGEVIQHSDPISFQDTGCCSQDEYIQGYRDQITYITKMVQQTIDQILSESSTPPIIIIQGDHGPGGYYDGNSMNAIRTYDRMSILNAYYFPAAAKQNLYANITPVNTFRVLFTSQFGMDFPLLPDKSYFAPGTRPYDFSELPSEWLQK